MNTTKALHELGQSLWLDQITRGMLDDGRLRRYIDELSVTGLTSNPTIFNDAIGKTDAYDATIRRRAASGSSGEALFMDLALDDLRRAADLFRPVFEASGGRDGWVSMEVSPLLADDTQGSIAAAARIRDQAGRPNLFVKIPGTPAGLPAIEESIFAGVPINVTLLFSREQYLSSAEAYLRGIERRIAKGLDPRVPSVASLFVSRWDKAVNDRVPSDLKNKLGLAIGARVFAAYRALLDSPRWRALEKQGALPQRLLWASTGTKDPSAPDTLYIEALATPDTIDTMPEKTLLAFADHGHAAQSELPVDAAERTLSRFAALGIDLDALAKQLQREGAAAFVKSWRELMDRIETKSEALAGGKLQRGGLGLPSSIRACLFDLDGVLTKTAAVHDAAWQEVFDAFLKTRSQQTGEPFVPFDPVSDFASYVNGRSRLDGIHAFLETRGITLPEGKPKDEANMTSVHGLAKHKDQAFLRRLRAGHVQAFKGSARYVRAAREHGLKVAVVSSSRNCRAVLEAVHLLELFEVVIDGQVREEQRLGGKPSPDTYLAAARALHVEPAQAAVFEDAVAGVEAGRAGGFGYVVGVDRLGQAAQLQANGANVVVGDLAELFEAS